MKVSNNFGINIRAKRYLRRIIRQRINQMVLEVRTEFQNNTSNSVQKKSSTVNRKIRNKAYSFINYITL